MRVVRCGENEQNNTQKLVFLFRFYFPYIIGRRHSKLLFEALPEINRAAHANLVSNLRDGKFPRQQELLSPAHPDFSYELIGGNPCQRFNFAIKRGTAH